MISFNIELLLCEERPEIDIVKICLTHRIRYTLAIGKDDQKVISISRTDLRRLLKLERNNFRIYDLLHSIIISYDAREVGFTTQ